MEKKLIIRICFILFGLLLLGGAIYIISNYKKDSNNQTELANPASTNCVEKGGLVEIRTEMSSQGQVGYCVFTDNSECEEWSFFRDECAQSQCQRECQRIGTKSEGLYNSCNGELIKWMDCQ
jgi:putative hemolysin